MGLGPLGPFGPSGFEYRKRRTVAAGGVLDWRVPRGSARQADDAIIGARVAVDADLVEGGGRGAADHRLPRRRGHRGISGNNAYFRVSN